MTKKGYRTWYHRMPEEERSRYNRIRHLKKKYRLTDQEAALFVDMASLTCDICGATAYAVDHDHETGRVRGVLCNRCNSMLGWVEQQGLERVQTYLDSAELFPR